MITQRDIENKTDNQIFLEICNILRPLIKTSTIKEEGEKSLSFDFNDPIRGPITLRAYAYQGSAVLTSWDEGNNFTVSYVSFNNATSIATFKKDVENYLTDPVKHYEKPMLEDWEVISKHLAKFVKTYGVIALTTKMLDVPYMDDAMKAKMLAYLHIDECVRDAKEFKTGLEIAKRIQQKKDE